MKRRDCNDHYLYIGDMQVNILGKHLKLWSVHLQHHTLSGEFETVTVSAPNAVRAIEKALKIVMGSRTFTWKKSMIESVKLIGVAEN